MLAILCLYYVFRHLKCSPTVSQEMFPLQESLTTYSWCIPFRYLCLLLGDLINLYYILEFLDFAFDEFCGRQTMYHSPQFNSLYNRQILKQLAPQGLWQQANLQKLLHQPFKSIPNKVIFSNWLTDMRIHAIRITFTPARQKRDPASLTLCSRARLL